MRLKYTVEGDPKLTKQWFPGVPASSHETQDYEQATDLIASGLYEEDTDMAGEPDRTQNEVMPLVTQGQEPTESAKAAEGEVTGPMTDETRHAAENAPTPHGPVETEADEHDELPVADRDLGPETVPSGAEAEPMADATHSDNPDLLAGPPEPPAAPEPYDDSSSTPFGG